jgi:hypothetical protein
MHSAQVIGEIYARQACQAAKRCWIFPESLTIVKADEWTMLHTAPMRKPSSLYEASSRSA